MFVLTDPLRIRVWIFIEAICHWSFHLKYDSRSIDLSSYMKAYSCDSLHFCNFATFHGLVSTSMSFGGMRKFLFMVYWFSITQFESSPFSLNFEFSHAYIFFSLLLKKKQSSCFSLMSIIDSYRNMITKHISLFQTHIECQIEYNWNIIHWNIIHKKIFSYTNNHVLSTIGISIFPILLWKSFRIWVNKFSYPNHLHLPLDRNINLHHHFHSLISF